MLSYCNQMFTEEFDATEKHRAFFNLCPSLNRTRKGLLELCEAVWKMRAIFPQVLPAFQEQYYTKQLISVAFWAY